MILYIHEGKTVCMCRCSKKCHNKRDVLKNVIEYIVTCFRTLIKVGRLKKIMMKNKCQREIKHIEVWQPGSTNPMSARLCLNFLVSIFPY